MKLAVTTLVFCVAALLALGMVMLYSSSMTQVGAHYLIMQLIWGALGLVSCLVATALDYRILKKLALPLLALAIGMLFLVFVPHIGLKINGARRWLDVHIPGLRVQPSEFAKLALLVFVAWYGDRYQRHMGTFGRGIVVPGLFIAPVLGLIILEPDYGSTMLLATVSAMLLLLAGVRWKYFVPPVLAGAAGLTVMILHNPLRMKRIFSWLDLEQTKSGVGYQAYQAMLALGAGGWTGLGLGNGRQKLGFVPEQHTDFIFSIIGEELGLTATLLVVAAFVVLIICGLYIARHARDSFGLLLGAGITFLIGLQAFINIGVVTSVLPNKGLPLPFISYGGSSLLMMLTCVGVLLSIARLARDPAVAAIESNAADEAALEPAS
ncbi:MAG TPA: putative lipid II flippase FtsW [Dongiaceae bacterium]|nr:putative lipid II flippase FtsW [Dongiaceae bacterium]